MMASRDSFLLAFEEFCMFKENLSDGIDGNMFDGIQKILFECMCFELCPI